MSQFAIICKNDLPPTTAPRAFTLVELLVVISIIVLLISILLPALNRARDSANTVSCLSSLRQLGQFVQLYAGDNKQYVPIAKYNDTTVTPNVSYTWEEPLLPYFDSKFKKLGVAVNMNNLTGTPRNYLWACPMFMETWTGVKLNPSDDLSHRCGYGMNLFPEAPNYYGFPAGSGTLANPVPLNWFEPDISRFGRWTKLNEWRQPSQRAMFGDTTGPQMYVNPPSASGGSTTIEARHSRGKYANILCWDGSASSLLINDARFSVRFTKP